MVINTFTNQHIQDILIHNWWQSQQKDSLISQRTIIYLYATQDMRLPLYGIWGSTYTVLEVDSMIILIFYYWIDLPLSYSNKEMMNFKELATKKKKKANGSFYLLILIKLTMGYWHIMFHVKVWFILTMQDITHPSRGEEICKE